MKVIFFKDDKGFPVKRDGVHYSPRPVVGGFLFEDTPTKRQICKILNIKFQIVELKDIEFLEPEPNDNEIDE